MTRNFLNFQIFQHLLTVPFVAKKQANTRITEAEDVQVAAHFSVDPFKVEPTNPSNAEANQMNFITNNATSIPNPGKAANFADSTNAFKVE